MKRKGQKMQAAALPIIEIDNPAYEPGHPTSIRRIKVERALRDDPLGQMHARGQVKEHQYLAGRAFQAAAECISIGHVRSIDTTAEPVDGNPPSRVVVTPRYLAAMDRRKRWLVRLGEPGFRLLEVVLIEKLSVREAAQRIYLTDSKAGVTYVGHRFRECLDEVAISEGLMS